MKPIIVKFVLYMGVDQINKNNKPTFFVGPGVDIWLTLTVK